MSDRVKELKAAIREAERTASKLWADLFAVQCEEAGIAPGDLVEELSGDLPTGRRGVVMKIDFSFGDAGRPWVAVRLLRKDGTVGGATAQFYHRWRKVEA